MRDLNPKVATGGQGIFHFKCPFFSPTDVIHCISYIVIDKNLK
jgi:hypothetical protein